MMALDAQLTELEHALDSFSSPPDQSGAENMMRRFPWLSSLLILDEQGQLLAAMPPVGIKPLDFQPLLDPAPRMAIRDLRGNVQDTQLGPEILLARPFLKGSEVQVYLVATFDFRSLLPFVSAPGDLIVRDPDTLLWSGDVYYNDTALAGVNWQALTRKQSYGVTGNASSKYAWLVRYLGNVPLIFATSAS
jgi:hypothetical protein